MRILLTILLLISLQVRATNYYISNAGSDAANGLTTGTSWQTIAKVNASSFSPGDQILFNSGDTWIEQLVFPSSGSIGNPIIVSSYGTGLKPLITGFKTATGFTDSSGIKYTTLTGSVKLQNTITVDGVLTAKGRTPNTTYYSSYPNTYTQLSLYGGTLPYNFTGAEAVVQEYAWIWDHVKISAQSGTASGSTISLQDSLTYSLSNSVINFFIQNDVRTIDLPNEWAVDSATKKFWIKYTGTPNIQYSTIDTIVKCHNVNYITFQNLSITGGNIMTFSTDTTRGVILKNCTINNSGRNAINLNKSHQTTIQNDSVMNTWNDGIYTRWTSDTCLFDNNCFKNTGLKAGMNMNGNSANCGIFYYGTGTTFTNNKMDSTGYHGIYWAGNSLIKNNYITNYCITKEDGGGIYTAPVISSNGAIVHKNIVINGVGINAGSGAGGIYLDNQSTGVYVDSNTVYRCGNAAGLIANGGVNLTFRRNTVVNDIGYLFYTGAGTAQSNLINKNNIFYSTYRNQPVFFSGVYAGISEDSNYILRVLATDSLFQYGQNNLYYTLLGWQTLSNQDMNSIASFPSNATSQIGTLYYNPTLTDSTFNLSGGTYTDLYGTNYSGSAVIHSFESKLLFPIPIPIFLRSSRLKFLKVK
jgi:hypothetical protein